MRLLVVVIKFISLSSLLSIGPALLGYLIAGPVAAWGAAGVCIFCLIVLWSRANPFLVHKLRPKEFIISGVRTYTIEDPSSHVFATQGLIEGAPRIWITRGALSLLTPTELEQLIAGMNRAASLGGLRFETFLTSLLIRATSHFPDGFRQIFFFKQKTPKSILIRESASGMFWLSVTLLLEIFYLSRRSDAVRVPEEILRKLEAESKRCVPRLPAALSGHSAVPPWPEALLVLGRPCLLPRVEIET